MIFSHNDHDKLTEQEVRAYVGLSSIFSFVVVKIRPACWHNWYKFVCRVPKLCIITVSFNLGYTYSNPWYVAHSIAPLAQIFYHVLVCLQVLEKQVYVGVLTHKL